MRDEETGVSGEAGELRLEEFLPYRFSVITNRVSRHLAKAYENRFGISIPEWRVIANLARFAPMTAGEAAERSSMDKVKVSRAISKLVEAGLVIKSLDDDDRRRGQLVLSPEGERVFHEIVPLALGWEQQLLQGLTEAERQSLHSILDKIQNVLDDVKA